MLFGTRSSGTLTNKSAFRIVMTESDEYNRAVAIYHLVLVYERRI